MPKPNELHRRSSGSPLSRVWNPFHLRPVARRMLPDLDHGRSQIGAHFHMLTRGICATSKGISSLQIPYNGDGEGLPHEALTISTMTYSDSRHLMTSYSGPRCLEIHHTTNSPNKRDVLTVLPELLAQTYGLRLSSHFSSHNFRPLHL